MSDDAHAAYIAQAHARAAERKLAEALEQRDRLLRALGVPVDEIPADCRGIQVVSAVDRAEAAMTLLRALDIAGRAWRGET